MRISASEVRWGGESGSARLHVLVDVFTHSLAIHSLAHSRTHSLAAPTLAATQPLTGSLTHSLALTKNNAPHSDMRFWEAHALGSPLYSALPN